MGSLRGGASIGVRRVLITPLDQTSKVTPAPHVLGRVLMKAVT